jgi:hypothetical protein
MAVTLKGQSAIYEGASTDTKPTDVDNNTIFKELDTGINYYYDGTDWNEIPKAGGGFTPTESQLTAMNSGINAEDVEQIATNETNISKFHNPANVYFSETTPTGTIPPQSYWISSTGVHIYGIDVYGATLEQGSINSSTGAELPASNRVRTTFDDPLVTGTYTISADGADSVLILAYTNNSTDSYSRADSINTWPQLPYTFTTARNLYIRFVFKRSDDESISPSDITNVKVISETWTT